MKLKSLKKIWHKKFTNDELEEIQRIFLNFSITYSKNILGKENLNIPKDFLNNRKTFAYLETDRWDGSEGISPKQLKKLINLWGLDNLYIALWCISYLSDLYLHFEDVFSPDDDNKIIISYKEILKLENFQVFFNSIEESLKLTIHSIFNIDIFERNYELSYEIIPLILTLNESKLYKDEFLEKNSIQEIYEEFSISWKEHNGFIPHESILYKLDHTLWDKENFLKSMFNIFKIKQFRKLNLNDQSLFLNFYKLTGINSELISTLFKEESLNINIDVSNIILDKESSSFIKRFKNKDLSFNEFIILMKVSNSKKFRNTFKETQDIKILIQLERYIDYIDTIPINQLLKISKLNFTEENIDILNNLYLETKDILTTIPIHSNQINNDYKWEMLTKDNFDSLLAGNFTQCCQRIGGIGRKCLTVGARLENTAIFAIYKNDVMICQSYVWMGIGDDEEKYIVFDSIECVSYDYSDIVKQAYKEYKDIVSKNYTLLSGYIRNINNTEDFIDGNRIQYINPVDFIEDSYTDATSQFKLI